MDPETMVTTPHLVLFVQHDADSEDAANRLRVCLEVRSTVFEIGDVLDATTMRCIVRAMRETVCTVLVDSEMLYARRNLFTFVGSLPLVLRPRVIVYAPDDASALVWAGTTLRVVRNRAQLQEVVHAHCDGVEVLPNT